MSSTESLTLCPDWRERVHAAIEELDRRLDALMGASIVPVDEFEHFEMLLRVAQGGELPRWEGPPLDA